MLWAAEPEEGPAVAPVPEGMPMLGMFRMWELLGVLLAGPTPFSSLDMALPLLDVSWSSNWSSIGCFFNDQLF